MHNFPGKFDVIKQSRSLGASLVRDDHSAPSTFTGSSEARPATTRLVKQADKATKHAGSHTQSGCSTRQLSVEPVTAPGAAIESFSLVAYWPAGRLIPRSNLIISRNESAIGPDVEFSTYKGILNVAGICGGCHFRGGKTLKVYIAFGALVELNQVHHRLIHPSPYPR